MANQVQTKRVFNFRVFVALGLSCVLVASGFYVLFINIFIGLILLVSIFCLQVFLCFYYRHKIKVHECSKRDRQVFVFSILMLATFVLIGGVFFIRIATFAKINSGEYYFSGRADSVWTSDDGGYSRIILDIDSINNTRHGGQMQLNVTMDKDSGRVFISPGTIIKGYGYLQKTNLIESGSIATSVLKNIRYQGSFLSSELIIQPHSLTGLKKLRQDIGDFLNNNLSPISAAVAKAMIFGDKADLNSDTMGIFVFSGFSHILAVSGLHLSIFGLIIDWLLRLLRVPKKTGAVFCITSLFLFSAISGFSVSVLRAFLMTSVAKIATMTGRPYDSLNALGLAACVLVVINPFWIFSAGFILSFGVVLGITLFYRSVLKRVQGITIKQKILPKKLAPTLALLISVQLVSIPLTIYLKGYFGTYSFLTNLIFMLPITIIFSILVVISFLGVLIPPLGMVLQLLDIVIKLFVWALGVIADLPLALIYINPSVWAIVVLVIALIMASRFMLRDYWRKVAIVSSIIAYVLLIVGGVTWVDIKYAIVPLYNNSSYIALQNKKLAFISSPDVSNQLHNNFLYDLDLVFLTDDNYQVASEYKAMWRVFRPQTLVVPYTIDTQFLIALKNYSLPTFIMQADDSLVIDGFKINLIQRDNVFLGYGLRQIDLLDTQQANNILISRANSTLTSLKDELANYNIVRGIYGIDYDYAYQIVDYKYFYDNKNILASYNKDNIYFDFLNWQIKALKIRGV